MAEGSPLPFPSPRLILGDHAATAPAPANAADDASEQPENAKKDTKHARRPSKDRKTAPRKAPAVDKDANVVKPKQTKSRNGCVTCKAKRLKCGEEKPACQNCAKRKIPCGGYKKVFQWRDYGKPDVKTNIERQKQATSNSPVRKSADSSASVTPSNEHPPKLPGLPQVTPVETKRNGQAASPDHDGLPTQPSRQRRQSPSPRKHAHNPRDSIFSRPVEESPEPAPPPEPEDEGPSSEFASVNFNPQSLFAYRTRSLSPAPVRGRSPTLTEFLQAEHPLDDVENGIHQDFVPFSLPDDMHLPLWTTGADDPTLTAEHIFEDPSNMFVPIQNIQGHSFAWSPGLNTPTSSDTPGSPNQSLAQWNHPLPQIFMQPEFPIDSHEHLAMRFLNTTCGILSIMDGATENPWRTLIWPMAQTSAALYHALMAMAAYHAAHDFPVLRVVGHENKHASIQNIGAGIRDVSMSDQAAIATALALAFSESWDQHTATGNSHIKGAQVLVGRCVEGHRRKPVTGVELSRLKFLCNAWVFMDVISRLTSVDSDESNDFDNAFLFASNSSNVVQGTEKHSKDGFGINFGMPIDARLDPLMGCAGTLFPLIGRVANLVRKVCRSQTNSPGIVSHARDLKFAIDRWESPEEIECPQDPTTAVQDTLQTAEAYRWATLLHLHQSVPELPSLTSADLAQKILAALATVPTTSRTLVVQIYPLMVAGCEASEAEDRQWVRERWQVMAERMRIGVIDKCMQVTEEVWRRKDAYEAKPITHRKLVKTAELNPARRRGSPFPPRRATEVLNSDPGRTGVVFSYVESESEPMGNPLKDLNGPESARWRKDVSDRVMVDPAYSVRGHLHWVGVMWDWGWEVLLG
ncbi:related to fungal transcriptional regulatory [Lecanosticta acicola]|uniref:Related to fungal transcriptional regulatory n=1 Tax=Lecanosticta acicola TaxID=111012 RepID=A0AAI8Z3B9_9PEZI|nr:related to fungal transcriptional regulatory [Lecanosticta acicola]